MKSQTFDIGECSFYGRWRIDVGKKEVLVTGMDWHTRRIKEQKRFSPSDRFALNKLEEYLCSISTSYHADQMMEFVKEHLEPVAEMDPFTVWDSLGGMS